MNLDTTPGSLVRFAHPSAGYEPDKARARTLLVVGRAYVVSRVVVDAWRTDVWLEGLPKPFNSVLFDNIEPGTAAAVPLT